ncbi:MAG: hypothetical protein KatS3mg057_0128 [Herpetosiphonaceae bacterium]|nr:MAG: hypothetical protein KatS3mg057_0128 [Herpetosiphonaceae bacterium]
MQTRPPATRVQASPVKRLILVVALITSLLLGALAPNDSGGTLGGSSTDPTPTPTSEP